MPIYSLANIASDRRDPRQGRVSNSDSYSDCDSDFDFEWQCNICRHDCQDRRIGWSGVGSRDSGSSGYWIMCKNLKCKQLYAFIVSLGRRPPLKLLRRPRKNTEPNRKGTDFFCGPLETEKGDFWLRQKIGKTDPAASRKRFRLIKLADAVFFSVLFPFWF